MKIVCCLQLDAFQAILGFLTISSFDAASFSKWNGTCFPFCALDVSIMESRTWRVFQVKICIGNCTECRGYSIGYCIHGNIYPPISAERLKQSI